MKVQIIIPSINLWAKYSKPCIDSVLAAMMSAKKRGIDCRILFIDNGSTDETKEEAGKYVSDLFAHKRNEERWGFQKTVNFGVADAWERGFEFALVCNNDIILHPEAIWRLVDRFNVEGSAPFWNVGMVTALDIREETTPSLITSLNPAIKAEVEEAAHPNFSAFMVDKGMWEAVGEFDEAFAPAYFEDNDYHYRMSLVGYDAIVLPTALFYHYGSGTNREANGDGTTLVKNEQFEKNKATYAKKWGGLPGHEQFDRPYNELLEPWSTAQKPFIHTEPIT